MAFNGNTPPKGSKQWRKNESIIAKNPILRAARDTAEGFRPGSGITSAGNSQAYKDGWDRIFGGDRSRVNHKDTDEDSTK